jgi:penicillin-binding protein 1C
MVYQCLPDYRNAVQEQKDRSGLAVVDRNGKLLRLFPDSKGTVTLWCQRSQIPPVMRDAAIAAEDRRFYSHWGFDPVAIARAAVTNIQRGRTVSGASTITQQVTRLIQPRPRTYVSKIIETFASMKMEWQLSKDEILELYFNLCPMGGNIRGVGLASRVYFGKDIERITLPEAAILAAIPRSPSRYNPRRTAGHKQLIAEKDRILRRMAAGGMITKDQLRLALGNTMQFKRGALPMQAPHFVDLAVRTRGTLGGVLSTTLDSDIQRSVERIVRTHTERLRRIGIEQVAAVVASTDNLDVLAMMGSMSYGEQSQGYNNGALARRSAGSTLKPFLYALALEMGYEAFSEIPDTFRSYRTPHGDYLPANADRRSYGPVNVRTALGNSLNISAVKVLHTVGVSTFFDRLQQLDVAQPDGPPAGHFGLGLAIGNLEVNLLQLVQAYGALAREGSFVPLRMIAGEQRTPRRVFSPQVAFVINDILADPSARLLTFGNPDYLDFGFSMPIKTGTSTNYRDDWIVGYTPRHIVGIWAGNFGGGATSRVAGARACGPILKDIVRYLYHEGSPGVFKPPRGQIRKSLCWLSGKLATDKCPHTIRDYVVHPETPIPVCDLPHEEDYHLDLGAQYAHWLNRREAEQGRGRYRLMTPWGPTLPGNASPTMASSDPPPSLASPRARIRIVNPHEADRFVRSRHLPNRIVFRAVPDTVVDHVTWLIDGEEVGRSAPPYELVWEMSRGTHVLHAVTPSFEAAQITFSVE